MLRTLLTGAARLCLRTVSLALFLAALGSAAPALAQSNTIAVVPFVAGPDGEAPPEAYVEAVRAALENGGRTWVMPQDEARATLSAGQLLGGDTGARELVSLMQQGVDAFYDDRLGDAEELLGPAIERALQQPMLLVLDANLAEQTKSAMLVLPRVLLGGARFDEAAAVTARLVEVFPTYIPSRKLYPPNIVDMVEQSRTQHTSLGKRLVVRPASATDNCAVNLNGDEILLETEREVPVSTAGYGLMLRCGEREVGPYLVTMSRVEHVVPVSGALIESLAPAETGQTVVLPGGFDTRGELGQLLTSLLGVEQVYLVGLGADGLLAVRVSRDGTTAAATLDAEPSADAGRELARALERGLPSGAVAVDTGLGWRTAESPSYVAEYVIMGTGVATLVTGAVFLGLASSQSDVVADCKEAGACRQSTSQDNGDLYATNLFVGQLLTGLGAAIAVTGGTIFLVRFLTADEGGDATAGSALDGVGLSAGPDGAMATWRLSW